MPVRSYDVDGYTGLVYMERTPHDEKKGVDFLLQEKPGENKESSLLFRQVSIMISGWKMAEFFNLNMKL